MTPGDPGHASGPPVGRKKAQPKKRVKGSAVDLPLHLRLPTSPSFRKPPRIPHSRLSEPWASDPDLHLLQLGLTEKELGILAAQLSSSHYLLAAANEMNREYARAVKEEGMRHRHAKLKIWIELGGNGCRLITAVIDETWKVCNAAFANENIAPTESSPVTPYLQAFANLSPEDQELERTRLLGELATMLESRDDLVRRADSLASLARAVGVKWKPIAKIFGITEQGMQQRLERLALSEADDPNQVRFPRA